MNIQNKQSILDKIEIALPCTVAWDNMEGNASMRSCSQCRLTVYNVSEMSKEEAQKLIQEHEGQLCVRLYRRFDGTVITNDYPVGLRKLKRSLQTAIRIAATILSFFLGILAVSATDTRSLEKIKQASSSEQISGKDQIKSKPLLVGNKKSPMSSHLSIRERQLKGEPVMGRYTISSKKKLGEKAK